MIRHYGKPQNNAHAVQLVLAQEIYLDDERGVISQQKAERLQPILKDTFVSLAEALRRMP
jgi:N-formylglutamate amidohydrolase